MSDKESYHENESVESNMEQKNIDGKKKLNQTTSSQKSNNTNKNNLTNSKISKDEVPEPIQSTRAYLEENITKVVQQAMLELIRQNPKPNNPLQFIGEYLLKEANKK